MGSPAQGGGVTSQLKMAPGLAPVIRGSGSDLIHRRPMPDQAMLLDQTSISAEGGNGALGCSSDSYTLFQEPWWLDAVAPGEWDEVVVKRGGQVAARLPFVRKRKFGSVFLTQPRLTPSLGPWLRVSSAKRTNRLAEEKELMQELIAALPHFDLFRQTFAPQITNWLPFCWRGFSQTTRYTYRLSGLADQEGVWEGLRDSTRREIRKARNIVAVREDLDIDCFARIWSLTFSRQGAHLPVSIELLHRIDAACESRRCRRMFFAEDARGRVHAAAYILWNADCAYYLMGGGDPELRNSGAGSLVMWEAIKFASTVCGLFDFEGSMLEPVERFFRSFGGEPVALFSITKQSRRLRFAMGLYHAGSALLGHDPVI